MKTDGFVPEVPEAGATGGPPPTGYSVHTWPRGTAVVSVPITTVWDSPTAAREIDAPMVADTPLPHRWISNLDTAGRLGLMGRATTQALRGEPVIEWANETAGAKSACHGSQHQPIPLGTPDLCPAPTSAKTARQLRRQRQFGQSSPRNDSPADQTIHDWRLKYSVSAAPAEQLGTLPRNQ